MKMNKLIKLSSYLGSGDYHNRWAELYQKDNGEYECHLNKIEEEDFVLASFPNKGREYHENICEDYVMGEFEV